MSRPITYTDLAELFDATGNPKAAGLMREAAVDEDRQALVGEAIDRICGLLAEVPEPKGATHTDTCWRQHAPCLAVRIFAAMED